MDSKVKMELQKEIDITLAWIDEVQKRNSSKCVQCGNENDLMVAYTKYKVCGKCVKKNYKKAVGNKKGGK